MTHIFIKHSPTFWEVRPADKTGMRKLLAYIRMIQQAQGGELQEKTR